ncbi:tetratricopeptide repeat protein [Actinocorallia sp. API 0066]|uniref:tetratricopeptide repeat protein n=1 Tax=Actinocorallia sp. API 0066 TaxID=2896846 RepID=UPI001E3E5DC5|nr:tetratricopeptide repeat protein [Actinocorallia sp. API 0066]MCD0448021.1 tetratricopeptide repeat protein [Actinocorallia sp. API 0066]
MAQDADPEIFLSLGGCDRELVRRLVRELRRLGLRVFLDEDGIEHFAGITATIEAGLRDCKVLVAYYSVGYPERYACQYELTAFFLAGQREGDPSRRIIVINPEEETAHIVPVELADARFAVAPPGKAAMSELAQLIQDRVRRVAGPMGGVDFTKRPLWFPGRVLGAPGFVGRFREQWALHDALHRPDQPLTQEARSGPIAVVSGLPDSGRTAMVSEYAWQYGAAFLGGVHWMSLAGAGGDILPHYTTQLREVAETMGLAPEDDATRERLCGLLADCLAAKDEPSLWIIDDVPHDLPRETVERLLLPAGTRVRTVLITDRRAYTDLGEAVSVGPLATADARDLLSRYRPTDDHRAMDRVIEHCDGSPRRLHEVGRELRALADLEDYGSYAARLENGSPPRSAPLDGLSPLQLRVLGVAAVCAPAVLPARTIAAVLTDTDPLDLAEALTGLRERLLAAQIGSSWEFRRVAVETADPAAVARVIADDPDLSGLVPHAAAFAVRNGLPEDLREPLLARLASHHLARGEAAPAARYHALLLQRRPDDPDVRLAAAEAFLASGDHERALSLAAPHPAGALIAAEALDGLGRYEEADVRWRSLDPDEHLLPKARRLRRRGRLAEARGQVERVLVHEDDPEMSGTVQEARLELARIQLATTEQREARGTARLVIEHYRRRGLPRHRLIAEAQEVLAQALLSVAFTELKPDHDGWEDAELIYRDLLEEHRRAFGGDSVFSLSASVGRSYALVSRGRPAEALHELEKTLPSLRARLGSDHPIFLRTLYLLGLAHAQRNDIRRAEALLRAAVEGQLRVLGPTHPETLESRRELGVMLRISGDLRGAWTQFSETRRAAAETVGIGTDLHMQAFVSMILTPLPATIWRSVWRRQGHPPDA